MGPILRFGFDKRFWGPLKGFTWVSHLFMNKPSNVLFAYNISMKECWDIKKHSLKAWKFRRPTTAERYACSRLFLVTKDSLVRLLMTTQYSVLPFHFNNVHGSLPRYQFDISRDDWYPTLYLSISWKRQRHMLIEKVLRTEITVHLLF